MQNREIIHPHNTNMILNAERDVDGGRVNSYSSSGRRAPEGSRTQHATRLAVCGLKTRQGTRMQQATP